MTEYQPSYDLAEVEKLYKLLKNTTLPEVSVVDKKGRWNTGLLRRKPYMVIDETALEDEHMEWLFGEILQSGNVFKANLQRSRIITRRDEKTQRKAATKNKTQYSAGSAFKGFRISTEDYGKLLRFLEMKIYLAKKRSATDAEGGR